MPTSYPTDLNDDQWFLIQPLLPPAKAGGRPRSTDLRQVVNALFYVLMGGIAWRLLPHDYQKALCQSGLVCSMSRRGNCWDNAVAESFFSTLKCELLTTGILPSRSQAHTAIAEWLKVFYNRQRLHSANGYLSPVQFEQQYWSRLGDTLLTA